MLCFLPIKIQKIIFFPNKSDQRSTCLFQLENLQVPLSISAKPDTPITSLNFSSNLHFTLPFIHPISLISLFSQFSSKFPPSLTSFLANYLQNFSMSIPHYNFTSSLHFPFQLSSSIPSFITTGSSFHFPISPLVISSHHPLHFTIYPIS